MTAIRLFHRIFWKHKTRISQPNLKPPASNNINNNNNIINISKLLASKLMVCILIKFKPYLLDPCLQQDQSCLAALVHPETLYEPEKSWIFVLNNSMLNKLCFFVARLTFLSKTGWSCLPARSHRSLPTPLAYWTLWTSFPFFIKR